MINDVIIRMVKRFCSVITDKIKRGEIDLFHLYEPQVGLEPTNLFVTNEMLYQLSYCGLFASAKILIIYRLLAICELNFCFVEVKFYHCGSVDIGDNCHYNGFIGVVARLHI